MLTSFDWGLRGGGAVTPSSWCARALPLQNAYHPPLQIEETPLQIEENPLQIEENPLQIEETPLQIEENSCRRGRKKWGWDPSPL
eukprot:scaffold1825_cov181-Amphora_coffeaeformis.AAC.6